MRNLAAPFIVALLMTGQAHADPVKNAFTLCSFFDNTGLTSSPCEVSGWSRTVNVHLDMAPSEARKLCSQMVEFAWSQGMRFDGAWKLQFYSPFSGDNAIAYCGLR